MTDKKTSKTNENDEVITFSELNKILEVNSKSVEIQVEVAQQNEKVLTDLETIKENQSAIIKSNETMEKNSSEDISQNKEILKRIENIEKSIFQLMVIVGSSGIGLLLNFVLNLIKK